MFQAPRVTSETNKFMHISKRLHIYITLETTETFVTATLFYAEIYTTTESEITSETILQGPRVPSSISRCTSWPWR